MWQASPLQYSDSRLSLSDAGTTVGGDDDGTHARVGTILLLHDSFALRPLIS